MRALAGLTLAAALVATLLGRPAAAEGPAVFRYEVGGQVQSVRAIDLHGDAVAGKSLGDAQGHIHAQRNLIKLLFVAIR